MKVIGLDEKHLLACLLGGVDWWGRLLVLEMESAGMKRGRPAGGALLGACARAERPGGAASPELHRRAARRRRDGRGGATSTSSVPLSPFTSSWIGVGGCGTVMEGGREHEAFASTKHLRVFLVSQHQQFGPPQSLA